MHAVDTNFSLKRWQSRCCGEGNGRMSARSMDSASLGNSETDCEDTPESAETWLPPARRHRCLELGSQNR